MSGYHFLFVPGPSNVPAAVQQAIHCPMEDIVIQRYQI